MRRGVFAVDRGIWNHPFFKAEPFTQREAWLWMIGEASWKARRTRGGDVVVELRRGEFAHSLRFMAEAWGWKEPRVRRFLNRLKNDAMIDARTDAGGTVVTISNYDKYQFVPTASDAPSDAPNDTRSTQTRRTVKNGFKKEEGPVGAPPASKSMEGDKEGYAFNGRRFSVEPDQYERWRASYSAIRDLNAELQAIDDHLVDHPEKIKNGKPLHVVSRLLRKANGWATEGAARSASSSSSPEAHGDIIRIYKNDPRWPPLRERFERESNRTLKYAELWPFPAFWLNELSPVMSDQVS